MTIVKEEFSKNYVEFDKRDYRVGYARDERGTESIVICDMPTNYEWSENNIWTEGNIVFAQYYENRLSLNRLPEVLETFREHNLAYLKEHCIGDSATYPQWRHVRISREDEYAVKRDYKESDVQYVEVGERDHVRTVQLIKNNIIRLDKKGVKGNPEKFTQLNPKKLDSRLVALTLATYQIDAKSYDPSWVEKV